MVRQMLQLIRQFGGAIAFYTILPLPSTWPLEFAGIARWAPLIGVLLGGGLGLMDSLLQGLQVPILTRSALVVGGWVLITGGLHLDGVMDTADGLAVMEPQRRLVVMADSHTGAFGVMAAIAVLGLKTCALTDLDQHRSLALMAAAGWGRWGQLMAIACYPYLKPEGKGALHKANLQLPWDLLPGCLGLLGLGGLEFAQAPDQGQLIIVSIVSGVGIGLGTAAWLASRLKGHTGDTYGAIVEWTEALLLSCLTAL